jgi:aryl-alcohol dehydrogenase-like predicted oxidoreductase
MKLALGTVQFGLDYGVANTSGRIASAEAKSILKLASGSCMDTLDTAIAYGDSESVLGQLGVQQWNVVSKLPGVPEDCSDVTLWVRQEVQGSLSRLGVSRLYGLLLHRPSQLLGKTGPALYEALQSLKEDGLVCKTGVSVYGPAELDALFDNYQFDLIQAPFNILDRGLVESGWAIRLQSAGVEVHTRSAFLQGLLLMPGDQRPSKFDRWQSIWQEWTRWLQDNGLTPLQACLQYAVSQPNIDRVVVGVDTSAQLEEIIRAADGKLASWPSFAPLLDERLLNPAVWNQL